MFIWDWDDYNVLSFGCLYFGKEAGMEVGKPSCAVRCVIDGKCIRVAYMLVIGYGSINTCWSLRLVVECGFYGVAGRSPSEVLGSDKSMSRSLGGTLRFISGHNWVSTFKFANTTSITKPLGLSKLLIIQTLVLGRKELMWGFSEGIKLASCCLKLNIIHLPVYWLRTTRWTKFNFSFPLLCLLVLILIRN